jgi:hypothetical protein
MTADSSCEKEIRARIGKANTAFGKLDKIWKSNGCSLKTKLRLHNAIVLSTLLYGAETWPMTAADGRRLEAAHHRWLRRILHVSWRDKKTNKNIRERTGQDTMENIIRIKKIEMDGACISHGCQQKSKASDELGHWRKKKTRETEEELARNN